MAFQRLQISKYSGGGVPGPPGGLAPSALANRAFSTHPPPPLDITLRRPWLTIHMTYVSRMTFVHYMACYEFMPFIPITVSQSQLVQVVC